MDGVTLKVEMQTGTSKVIIGEFGGPQFRLSVGDTLENIVSHEIKELGQHVLACTVSYRSLPGQVHPGNGEPGHDYPSQSFRKFYKFAVTNPLSVKTKVHTPRSPSALLSREERDRVFLEVHIQNMTQDALWFERIHFECAEGWTAQDANVVVSQQDHKPESIFTITSELMQPQDMRQYIYILSPSQLPRFPVDHPPGAVMPLGRLDISWRSSFGEPGRLLTSTLSRRIPLVQAQPPQLPASALPPHLQRGSTVGSPRPRSPQLPQERPSTPPAPYRPASPFRGRTIGGPISPRPQSPGPSSAPAVTSVNQPIPLMPHATDIEVDLVVRSLPRDSIRLEVPFRIACTITVSCTIPALRAQQERAISLIIQHIQPSAPVPKPVVIPEIFSPRLPSSGFSTPRSPATQSKVNLDYVSIERKLMESPKPIYPGARAVDVDETANDLLLPPPIVDPVADGKSPGSRAIVFLGPSAIFLPTLRLRLPEVVVEDQSNDAANTDESLRVQTSQDFDLSYLPLLEGFSRVGGIRILLQNDRWEERGQHHDDSKDVKTVSELRILSDIAEIWVQT